VAVWDGVSPRASQLWTGHANGAKVVAFRGDGKILAVAFGSGSVNLWDVTTGHLLATLESPGHDPSEAASLSFSPDGTMLASAGSLASAVTVWDVASRKTLTTLDGPESGVHAIAFSHDGRWLASTGGDRVVRLWETQHWRPVRQPNGGLGCLAFSPDDRLLATCGRDRAGLWDVGEPELIASLQQHGEQVGTVLFSPEGAYLASASYGRDVAVWDVRARKPVGIYQVPPEPGNEFAFGTHGKELRVFAFSPDGTILATGGAGKSFGEGGRRGDLVLWDFARSGKATPLEGHRSRLAAVAFSPDGRQLAAADSGEALLWDLRTGSVRPLRQEKNALCLAFNPKGTKLAVGDGDDVMLWDLTSNHSPVVLHGHTFPVRAILFSPDGKTLVSGTFDGTVRFWDLTGSGPKLIAVGRHERDINSMALSADGRILATGSQDRRIGLWEMKTGKSIRSLTGQDAEIQSVALSPDGAKVASASENGRVILWNVVTGEPIVDLRRSATSVAFSPDGKLLATGGGQDHRVMLWDVRVDGWADHACAMANRNLTCDEWRQWMGTQPYRSICPQLPAPHGCGTS
jgi:WD40 repeat protein